MILNCEIKEKKPCFKIRSENPETPGPSTKDAFSKVFESRMCQQYSKYQKKRYDIKCPNKKQLNL